MNAKALSDKPSMKDRLLDAAEKLFYSKGIQAVGVDAIAAEAGISNRTLYNHFASKDALIAAYLARKAGTMRLREGPPLDQILGMFDVLAKWFGSKHFRGCPFVNAVAELSGERQHPAVDVAVAEKARILALLEKQLHALKANDPAELANQIMILVEGAIAISLVRGGDPDAAHAAQKAARILLVAAGVEAARISS